MPYRMRLRFRREANCNFPLLLQCLSYTIAHSQTREHAYVLTCKHTPTQMHPCCVLTQFSFAFCLSRNRMFRNVLYGLYCFIERATWSRWGEAIRLLFFPSHDCHIVIFSVLCSGEKIKRHWRKSLLIHKQHLRLQQAKCYNYCTELASLKASSDS